MDLRIIILAVVFTLVNSQYVNYTGHKVYKIIPKNPEDVKILVELEKKTEHIFWNNVIKEGRALLVMIAPEKQEKFDNFLKDAGIEGKVAIDNVQRLIEAQLHRPKVNRINNEYQWDYYQNLDEINEWIDNIVAAHSNVATIVEIGTSSGGRAIRGVVIDYKRQENPVAAVVESTLHAREWITPALATWMINEFLTSNDPEIRSLAENVVWHIFPVINPDGYVYSFTNNRMWRKNRNTAHATSCSQFGLSDDMSNGVDLNRNFGFLWMVMGASSNPCAETFAGPAANSELETRAFINYIQTVQTRSNLLFYYAMHSFSQMVLVPYSHLAGSDVLQAPNYADMFEIAVKGMDKLRQRNGTDYIVGTSSDILYPVTGSSFDWVKGVAEVPLVFLFELRDLGDFGFLLPPEYIVDNNKEVMDGLVEMHRVARQMGYYHHRSSAAAYTLQLILLLISLFITI